MEQEYNNIIQIYGSSETNVVLGNIDSYKDIRNKHSYIDVLNEMEILNELTDYLRQ